MATWEYRAETWLFFGAHLDPWPGHDVYRAKVLKHQADQPAGKVRGDILPDDPQNYDYFQWRDQAENEYLNAMGGAGFELVSVHRRVEESPVNPSLFWPTISVRAYFKREARPDAPDAPRNPIGFRPATSGR
ncbi:MAG TPA: hypothetical protein VFJ71_00225 [Candidatus Limnocylindrales bacterium]|nr:hypothetical protein [Candidatus Limnocylindrales bacterium]